MIDNDPSVKDKEREKLSKYEIEEEIDDSFRRKLSHLVISAEIEVTKAIKGSYKKGQKFTYEWREEYNVCCLHPKTETAYNKVLAIWYSEKGHKAEKPNLETLHMSLLKNLMKGITVQ